MVDHQQECIENATLSSTGDDVKEFGNARLRLQHLAVNGAGHPVDVLAQSAVKGMSSHGKSPSVIRIIFFFSSFYECFKTVESEQQIS